MPSGSCPPLQYVVLKAMPYGFEMRKEENLLIVRRERYRGGFLECLFDNQVQLDVWCGRLRRGHTRKQNCWTGHVVRSFPLLTTGGSLPLLNGFRGKKRPLGLWGIWTRWWIATGDKRLRMKRLGIVRVACHCSSITSRAQHRMPKRS